MPQPNQYIHKAKLDVEVRYKSGKPLTESFKDVSSIMEVSDEENETLAGLSVFSGGHWHNIKVDDNFDHAILRKRHA